MATVQQRALYRSILREVVKGAVSPRPSKNKAISSTFRVMFEKSRSGKSKEGFEADMENAVTFLRSQRTYKELLERYNPLADLTAEERIEATARRVGLNMPVTKSDEEQ
ncbi:hypothetical protein NEOLEDRAFT_1177103 [Neolentinus lepideus HHB14362 ss-1]|uniref:Uncharacterized protein n=1 Tax=Neolentinus lepideus HHB14362 ss-1 TaxID=1314782 RepID=A0A165TN54_9AGAM|nr:hypothetical protein NEOLEDRAFT_1177103 [Neolentinus lepideus HHB14362 ss-1]